jgi:hypothetical protein
VGQQAAALLGEQPVYHAVQRSIGCGAAMPQWRCPTRRLSIWGVIGEASWLSTKQELRPARWTLLGATWCWRQLLPGGSGRAHDRRDLWYQIGRSCVPYADDMFPLQRTGTHLVTTIIPVWKLSELSEKVDPDSPPSKAGPSATWQLEAPEPLTKNS